jgi:hypothetical protein
MTEWMPFGGRFVIGDVYRWHQPAWKPKGWKKSKSRPIGDREIIAQLTGVEDEILIFKLMSCKTTKNDEDWWKPIAELKGDEPLRKNRATLTKLKPDRRPWESADGEPARSISGGSKFLKGPSNEES